MASTSKRSITLYGNGALGMVALHAAALDIRITQVVAENAPIHRNLSEISIPGIVQHYDVGDLLEAIAPRGVNLVNPADALGQPMRTEQVRLRLSAAFDSDRKLGYPERIRLRRRGFRDPLPVE